MSLPERQNFYSQYGEDAMSYLISAMREKGISFQPGLDDSEIEEIESQHGFVFPADLQAFLSIAVPHPTHGFTDWRKESAIKLPHILRQKAADSICWQLTYCNMAWPFQAVEQPIDPTEMFSAVYAAFAQAPNMIPVLDRRFYLPCEPQTTGNPVFVLTNTNRFSLSYAAFDLLHFLVKRLALRCAVPIKPFPRRVEFWQSFVKGKS
jgi:hypothetical protein